MKAVRATDFGGANVLTATELPDPTPGPGQITIDVTHAAVGHIDVYLRQGLYKDQGLVQPPYVPGLEVAGTVRALGEGVTGFRVSSTVPWARSPPLPRAPPAGWAPPGSSARSAGHPRPRPSSRTIAWSTPPTSRRL